MEIPETYEETGGSRLAKPPWFLRDIILGGSIPVFFYVFGYGLSQLGEIRYRPWLLSPLSFCLTLLCDLILLFYPMYLIRKRKSNSLFGPFLSHGIIKEFLKSLFIFFLISLPIGLIISFIEMISKTEYAPRAFGYFPNNILFLLFLFFGFTLSPVCEEVFFRGFLYNALKTRTSVVLATLIQGALFGILHYPDLLNAFAIFLLGIALSIVYEKRKSLISVILVHAMKNAIVLIPVLIVALQNIHSPATNWNEAQIHPGWLTSSPSTELKRQKDGMQQWKYAIDTWGSKGSRNWKKEANAFNGVCTWFPEDGLACAKAKLGIVAIYLHYLSDYRRAVIEADNLLSKYPEQKEQCALALANKGWAYYLLSDFKNSRSSFTKVVSEFGEYREALESAEKGIAGLDFFEKK
jgi:uncharacterized protein